MNSDGSIDGTFNSAISAALFDSVAIQPDGKILIGGPFSFGYVNSQTGTISYNGIVRLNADGSRDTVFVPATTSNGQEGRFTEVSALALQSDGKILIGGRFTSVGGQTRNRIARVNADGTLDTSFNPNLNNGVYGIALQSDGKIIVGGYFTTCLLYTSPSPRDRTRSRMPSSA